MDVEKRKIEIEKKDSDIIYSHQIKAGKRIYYLDVKRSRNDDLFLAITESKKKVSGSNDESLVTYEKHKIFLYKEEFEKFIDGMNDVIGFIRREQGITPEPETAMPVQDTKNDEAPIAIMSEETKGKSFFDKFKFSQPREKS